MPGRRTSAVYFAWPVTLSRPSTRGCDLPTTLSLSLDGHAGGSSLGCAALASSCKTAACAVTCVPGGGFCPDAVIAAANTFGYVPQRQRLPETAVLTSSSDGFWLVASSAAQLMTMPGVQKPHCMASWAMNCSWIGASLSPLASPSTVVTARVPTSSASVMHEQTGMPSRCTVQALHEPRSHTTLVPVMPRSKRSASASVVPGITLK